MTFGCVMFWGTQYACKIVCIASRMSVSTRIESMWPDRPYWNRTENTCEHLKNVCLVSLALSVSSWMRQAETILLTFRFCYTLSDETTLISFSLPFVGVQFFSFASSLTSLLAGWVRLWLTKNECNTRARSHYEICCRSEWKKTLIKKSTTHTHTEPRNGTRYKRIYRTCTRNGNRTLTHRRTE